jgi:putative heme iron utilization protein
MAEEPEDGQVPDAPEAGCGEGPTGEGPSGEGPKGEASPAAGWEARQLLRAARVGTLATSANGQPFASLVTPATAHDLSVLLLISNLAEHTRHLRADPRCALMVAGAPDGPNPQTTPRLTVTGLAEPDPDPALKARFLAVHPYAALYADFADFAVWRLRPAAGLFVGGFGRAARLRGASLLPDAQAVAAIAAAEAEILAHCNEHHAEALTAAAGRRGRWRMVGVDVDGCDLAQDDTVLRVAWSMPTADPDAVRGELTRLAERARR